MYLRLLIRIIIWFGAAIGLFFLFSGIQYPWNWNVPWEYRVLLLKGFCITLTVSVGAILIGLCMGIVGGLARVSHSIIAQEISALYVELFRGTPLLVQIYLFYFCIAVAVHYDNPLMIGMVALAFFSGAYITEMVRAGIESVDKGQVEAAKSLGLNDRQVMRYVVFPQAFRRIIPPITGQFVSLIKDSSLLSVISVRELTKAAEVVNATTYKTFEAYLPLALLYLLLTYPLSRLAKLLEKKISSRFF